MQFSFRPEQFLVEEITPQGAVLEAGSECNFAKAEDASLEGSFFCHFVMQKSGWNTTEALGAIARYLHAKPTRFNFAGTKDRNATSTQLCSAFAIEPERILSVKVKDVKINGAWKAREKIKLGALGGNRFTITLAKENCAVRPDAARINAKASESAFRFPNFFGSQRFGMRGNTAEIGKHMLFADFRSAVMEYLCGGTGERNEDALKSRERLKSEMDFAKALEYFPYNLRFERTLIAHLAKNTNDYVGAIRKLPRTLQLMFIHAYESKLFNHALEARIAGAGGIANAACKAQEGDYYCLADEKGFPTEKFQLVEDIGQANELLSQNKIFLAANIIGSESHLSEAEKEALARDRLSQDAFNIKAMPELSSKGAFRTLGVPLKDFKCTQEGENAILKFSLPPGAYATSALEFLLS